MKFRITDWSGNVCFFGRRFDSFEDAWGFLYENTPEDYWQEYSVVEVSPTMCSRYLDPQDPRNGIKHDTGAS